jgi:hypothetical protein
MHLVELGLYSFIYNVLYSFLWGNIGTYKDFMGIHGNLMGLPGLIFTVAGNFSAHRGSLEDSVKAVVDTMLPDYASKLTIFAGDVPWMPWPGGWEQRNLSPFSMVTSRNHGDHLSLIHHPISIIYIYIHLAFGIEMIILHNEDCTMGKYFCIPGIWLSLGGQSNPTCCVRHSKDHQRSIRDTLHSGIVHE